MAVIPVTPGTGRNVFTYQDGSSNDHPAGVMEYLVGGTPTPVSSAAPMPVAPQAATSGGATPYHLVSAATTNAVSVKATAGVLYAILAFNTNAAARYLHLFDKATTAPVPGTDTPVMTILIPPSNGGVALPIPVGIQFAAGIGISVTGAAADNDATSIGAGDCIIDLIYK